MKLKAVSWLAYSLRLCYKVYCSLFFAISLILAYPFFKFFLNRKSRFPTAFLLMKIYAWCFHFFLCLPIRVISSPKKMPEKPFVICPNHSSFIDIPAIYRIFGNYFTFVGKKEIEKWPLFRIFYTSGMNILVDRKNQKGNIQSFKRMLSEIDAGNPLVIFPEGTITKDAPNLGEFKKGAFLIAIQKQIPIVPITFLTNYKRLERKTFFKGLASPGYCDVIIHAPIATIGMTTTDMPELEILVAQIIEAPFKDLTRKNNSLSPLFYPSTYGLKKIKT